MASSWITESTLTLPYGTLQTLHVGASEVRLMQNVLTGEKRVGKRVSLLGREDTVVISEVDILKGVDHDNVAVVFDVAEVSGVDSVLAEYEIIMPYYSRGSLFDAMNGGERFCVGRARDLMVRALRGLSYLHNRSGVLHRDVKPANIFLSDDSHLVKVGDFGEAVKMQRDRSADPLLAPQFWTPPETMCGSRYTVQSEVFAAGMTLRELLGGPFPYDTYTRESLARRLEQGRCALRPRDLTYPPHVPASIRRVVARATNCDPAGRYDTAEQMAEQLLGLQFIDWSWPEADGRSRVWSGRTLTEEVRLLLRPVRGRGWRARVERLYGSGWRQMPRCPDIDHHDSDAAAAAAFSQIDRQFLKTRAARP